MIILYVIYDHPKDQPNHFVVRKWFLKTKPDHVVPLAPFPGRVDTSLEPEWGGMYPISPQGTLKTKDPLVEVDRGALLTETLDEARALIPKGRVRLEKSENDDPVIVEVWA